MLLYIIFLVFLKLEDYFIFKKCIYIFENLIFANYLFAKMQCDTLNILLLLKKSDKYLINNIFDIKPSFFVLLK